MLKIRFEGKHGTIPTYQTIDAAGADLCAQAPTEESAQVCTLIAWRKLTPRSPLEEGHWVLVPGRIAKIPTGVFIDEVKFDDTLPEGCYPYLTLAPRSGHGVKGVTIINTPSIIDMDYRGEIFVTLINHGSETFVIEPGDRIAQLIGSVTFNISGTLRKNVERATGGHGSTGKK
jgi:dUTP pyrophosphatase